MYPQYAMFRFLFSLIILATLFIYNVNSENFFINKSGVVTGGDLTENRLGSSVSKDSKFSAMISAYTNLNKQDTLNLNQFILFNIGDKENFFQLPRANLINDNVNKQLLNQTTVNYCNFDPNLLSSKLTAASSANNFVNNKAKSNINRSNDVKQSVDIIVKGNLFNKSTEISGKLKHKKIYNL